MQRPWWQRLLLSAWVRPVLLVLGLLVVWDLTIRLFRIPPYLIPSPWSVVQQLGAEWPRLLKESMDPAKYQSELEKLVTDLALKTREIRSLEGAK